MLTGPVDDAAAVHERERRADNERHVHRATVDEETVRRLAMIPEALAVVARSPRSPSGRTAGARRRNCTTRPTCASTKEISPTIGVAGMLASVRLRRIVRRVRVVEVNPARRTGVPRLLQPWQRVVHDLVAATLDLPIESDLVLRQVEVVEVRVESLIDAPLRVEHVRADESAGRESARLEASRPASSRCRSGRSRRCRARRARAETCR